MASLLRQIVAGPRARHPEANLDLCYVTGPNSSPAEPTIIATSGPSDTYPKRAYRNPLPQLLAFLNRKHGSNWCIWEFRAEGTGYPDEAVENRIFHFPWPDHHPPPFALVPHVLASMRDWLWETEMSGVSGGVVRKRRRGRDGGEHVVVVHCKAGKGRSGTAACGYLIAEEGWERDDALTRFTERRMKPGWGEGVSIPSQLRWLGYVERWKNNGKVYVERKVEIVEVHVYGLRDGVRVNADGFIEEGKKVKTWHTFADDERTIIRGKIKSTGIADAAVELFGELNGSRSNSRNASRMNLAKMNRSSEHSDAGTSVSNDKDENSAADTGTSTPAETIEKTEQLVTGEMIGADAIFRPSEPVIVETNDVCIDLERRTRGTYTWALTTSVAHVWFNCFFEGNGPEQHGKADDSGVYEIEWEAMDGLKGSSRKGTKAFDRMSVVWRAVEHKEVVHEPKEGEEVKQSQPADWKGAEEATSDEEEGTQTFGVETPSSED